MIEWQRGSLNGGPSNSLRLYNKWGCPHHICCLALGSCILYDYKNEKSEDHARLLVLQTEALRLPFPVERATSDPTPIWYIYSWKGYNHTTWHLLVALLWQGIEISQVSVCHEQALSKRLPKLILSHPPAVIRSNLDCHTAIGMEYTCKYITNYWHRKVFTNIFEKKSGKHSFVHKCMLIPYIHATMNRKEIPS